MRAKPAEAACCGACGDVHALEYEWDVARVARATRNVRPIPLTCDEVAMAFLGRCQDASWTCRMRAWWKHHLRTAWKRCVSTTDADGWCGAGKMHLVSHEQAMKLLQVERKRCARGCLLDVGAGDGGITEAFAPLFQHTVVVETSRAMVRRLRAKPYVVLVRDVNETKPLADVRRRAVEAGVPLREGKWFDAILLLNVLDRCDEPESMLASIRNLLHPTRGKLVLAVVLPFRPFVEDGTRKRIPKEKLPLPVNCTWEEGVHLMVERVLVPAGYAVLSVSRAPYLCEGDLHHPVYSLDDAIFVLRPDPGQIKSCSVPCPRARPAGR
mmetsp:Transcript_8360/g.52127  ORF Transcript_8360/g.52127 Transcript_8360/m.52127 type:complete len:325 (+) Transcript_8360:5334-6308(+)